MIIYMDMQRRRCRNCLCYLYLSPVNVVRSELTIFLPVFFVMFEQEGVNCAGNVTGCENSK